MAKKDEHKKNKSNMVNTCKKATSLILDYLSEELDSETNQSFEDHLSECPDCVAFLNTYKKTMELTRKFIEKK